MTDLDWTGREHRMFYFRQCAPQPPQPEDLGKGAVIRWLLPLTVLVYQLGAMCLRKTSLAPQTHTVAQIHTLDVLHDGFGPLTCEGVPSCSTTTSMATYQTRAACLIIHKRNTGARSGRRSLFAIVSVSFSQYLTEEQRACQSSSGETR